MMPPRVLIVISAGLLVASCSASAQRHSTSGQDVRLPKDAETVEALVPRNATLEGLLLQQQVPREWSSSAVDAIRRVFNPQSLRANQPYRVTRTLDGLFREFQYQIDPDRFLRVVSLSNAAGPPQFDARIEEYPKAFELDAVEADITKEHSSLTAAFDSVGENVQLALALAEVFGGEVDFNSDLQRGDHVRVLFQRVIRDGQFAGYGDVEAAVLKNGGRTLTAIRYPGPDGKPTWYDEKGQSLKRQFLRSPLRFEPNPEVTSGFSFRRVHPIYGDVREHLGVDYGAAYGAPVVAIAPGVIEFADWSGDSGRLIWIRHAGGYESAYLHLSAFAEGIHQGTRVEQGQLIGRVGSSGAATGPHLDFRIKKNGEYVNPLTEQRKTPPGVPIPADVLARFTAERDRVLADLQTRANSATPTAHPVAHRVPSSL